MVAIPPELNRCAYSTEMAHHVEAKLRAREVSFWDLLVVVRRNRRKLGELVISQDSIDWSPGNSKSTYKLSWEAFDKIMRAPKD